MKVAIYYPWLYLKSGVERTILEIIKRGKHDYTIFTNHYDKKSTYPEFKKLKVIELKPVPVERDIFSVLLASRIILFQEINLKGFDVLLVHSEGMGDLILKNVAKIPTLCFCHTPLRPVFDEVYKARMLKKYTGLKSLVFLFCSYLFKTIDRALWKKYQYVIFSSYESFRRAKEGGLLTNFSKDNYEILHPGVDWKLHKPIWVYNRYFLIPGRIMWTKNIELGIKAFIKFKKMFQGYADFRLVIAGFVDKKSRDYFMELKRLAGARDDIEFVISPTDRKLRSLYANCYSVLFTAFNEDWGITLLEGNSYGKPLVAVNRGGPKESQIDGETGFLVSPNPKDFAKKMAILADNKKLVIGMGRKARENAKRFGWDSFLHRLDWILTNVL